MWSRRAHPSSTASGTTPSNDFLHCSHMNSYLGMVILPDQPPPRHVDGGHSYEAPCGTCDLLLPILVTSTVLSRDTDTASPSLSHRARLGAPAEIGCDASRSMRPRVCPNRWRVKVLSARNG